MEAGPGHLGVSVPGRSPEFADIFAGATGESLESVRARQAGFHSMVGTAYVQHAVIHIFHRLWGMPGVTVRIGVLIDCGVEEG